MRDKIYKPNKKTHLDTIKLFVEVPEEDLHFLDGIVKGYPGIANVRRKYIIKDGKKYFLILVAPDFLDEVKEVLTRLKEYIDIGESFVQSNA